MDEHPSREIAERHLKENPVVPKRYKWRVWFSSGNHADVEADTTDEAKRGPWNPSFGFITDVILLPDEELQVNPE